MMTRVLFWTVLATAMLLVGLVAVSPLVDNGPARVISLFARDATLRATSLASAAGLVVTAFVFFRTRRLVRPANRRTGAPMGA
jgi:hypothetical protein